MNKQLFFSMMMAMSVIITGCFDSEGGNSHTDEPMQQITPDDTAEENIPPVTQQKVSFKAITNAWFDQAPEDTPPSPEEVDFELDADEDSAAFDGLLIEYAVQEEVDS